MKKIGITIAILSLATLFGCSKEESNVKTNNSETKIEQKEEQKANTEEENQEVTSTEEETKEPTKTEPTISADMKKIGSPNYGYVYVPKDWVDFKDVDGNNSYQVSNAVGTEIISLNTIAPLKDAVLEDYANVVVENMSTSGGQNIDGNRLKLKNYDAIQLYCSYENKTYVVVAWVFKAEDGKVHYIAAEGPSDKILDVVGLIENNGWFAN